MEIPEYTSQEQRRYLPVAAAISAFPKFPLTTYPNQQYTAFVPSRYEGRFAIATSAGWDAVDADVPLTNGAEAYGEVVWS
jgi:hypothetical protein